MEIRMAEERDYFQLAEMKWLHCAEDDIDYHEKNLVGVEKNLFFAEVPKPNGNAKYIAYLTNVFTRKEYRNRKIGTKLLAYIKDYLAKEQCELMFAWPSDNSVDWYARNGFCGENEIFECILSVE